MDQWDDDSAAVRSAPVDDHLRDDAAGVSDDGGNIDDRGNGADEGSADDEQIVRRYLTFIADPASLRDDDRIAELQARIDAAEDPIEKVELASELHRARNVDGEELRRRFVAVARRWAEARGIVPEAFHELGVPNQDLAAAGFDLPPGRAGRRAETGTVAPSRQRAPRARTEDVRAAALAFDGPFTIADLRDRVGGSPATVRKALDAMVAEDLVESLGPDSDWGGPGRPPNRYVPRGR